MGSNSWNDSKDVISGRSFTKDAAESSNIDGGKFSSVHKLVINWVATIPGVRGNHRKPITGATPVGPRVPLSALKNTSVTYPWTSKIKPFNTMLYSMQVFMILAFTARIVFPVMRCQSSCSKYHAVRQQIKLLKPDAH